MARTKVYPRRLLTKTPARQSSLTLSLTTINLYLIHSPQFLFHSVIHKPRLRTTQLQIRLHKLPHHLLTLAVPQIHNLHALGPQVLLAAHALLLRLGFRLANHDAAEPVEQDCAGAHGAGRERREDGRAAELGRMQAAAGCEGGHLALVPGDRALR
jgi:hypothetical protein